MVYNFMHEYRDNEKVKAWLVNDKQFLSFFVMYCEILIGQIGKCKGKLNNLILAKVMKYLGKVVEYRWVCKNLRQPQVFTWHLIQHIKLDTNHVNHIKFFRDI